MTDNSIKTATQANKAAWEASAPLHGTGEDWDRLLAAAGKPGFSVLDDSLTDTLKTIGIDGRRAVQIGCNNARELLSLAALGGVPALGIDQAAGFLDQGRQLAQAANLTPTLLEADIYDLPDGLGTFDLALITIGVLNWMPDLEGFFAVVAGLMAPGAALVIYETHPFMEVFDPTADTPFEPAFSYFDRRPHISAETITYDGIDHGEGAPSHWFIHTLGDIVSACIRSGLTLDRLTEHPYSIREPDYDIYEGRAAQIPMSYTLVARR